MAESHPVELRIRIVRAYESGDESYPEIAARFDVGEASAKRWVWLYRRTGGVEAIPKAGGTPSIESGGHCRKSTSAASRLARPTRFVALPGARGIALPRLTVGTGSLTAATLVDPGDLWG